MDEAVASAPSCLGSSRPLLAERSVLVASAPLIRRSSAVRTPSALAEERLCFEVRAGITAPSN